MKKTKNHRREREEILEWITQAVLRLGEMAEQVRPGSTPDWQRILQDCDLVAARAGDIRSLAKRAQAESQP